jgi:hypothetical protein
LHIALDRLVLEGEQLRPIERCNGGEDHRQQRRGNEDVHHGKTSLSVRRSTEI